MLQNLRQFGSWFNDLELTLSLVIAIAIVSRGLLVAGHNSSIKAPSKIGMEAFVPSYSVEPAGDCETGQHREKAKRSVYHPRSSHVQQTRGKLKVDRLGKDLSQVPTCH